MRYYVELDRIAIYASILTSNNSNNKIMVVLGLFALNFSESSNNISPINGPIPWTNEIHENIELLVILACCAKDDIDPASRISIINY